MKPLVGISCCSKSFGPNGLPNHAASDFCVRAIRSVCDAVPVLLPAIGCGSDADTLLARLDGILLTGSRTNIAPTLYGAACPGETMPQDPARDATTLPLIRAAVARGTPILAICRGMQEMNVALGGTLHQRLMDLPGRIDHAAALPEDAQARVAPAHTVLVTRGGLLHSIAKADVIEVNSLHHQGIATLATSLGIEGIAPDGTIEAVRVITTEGFGLGVQWHPEFDALTNPLSTAVFRSFGAALHRDSAGRLAAD
jgi:putative glutamine amidotransferase